jgi:ubiquinone/menaquinone biosynthesis C-methylase UbiE
MMKKLFFTSAAISVAAATASAEPKTHQHPHEHKGAANQFMHQADFERLVARFEDPARAEWQKPEAVLNSLQPLKGKTVADIGAGTGYFAFRFAQEAAKVIAIDIDQRFLDHIREKKETEGSGANLETRLTTPDSPGLKPQEADVVVIVNTFHHIENRVEYLKKLKEGLRPDGVLVILDFKKEKTPPGPPVELRLSPEQVQSELTAAGFTILSADGEMLPYQYLIRAR